MTMVPAPVHKDLFEAVHGGDDDAVVRLLRSGAPAEATDEEGDTALYTAAVDGRTGIVRLLLAAGADPGRASGEGGGDLPLCGAACHGHTGAVRALLAAGAWPDQREEFGWTALAWAVRQGHAGTVRALLEYGADPGAAGPDGAVPLVAAARRGSVPVVRALLEHGAPGRAEALAEARAWLGRDVERVLRDGLAEAYGDGIETVTRRVAEGGGVTVVVEVLRDGRPVAGREQQTGHAAIATLLEAALGERPPYDELAGRALRCGDPSREDWARAAEVLGRRGDGETFAAAAAWCADGDPLRQAFGADVLARLTASGGRAGVFAARAVPVLRELAREAREAEVVLSVVRALGAQGDVSVLPDVLRHAVHPDVRVRRGVAAAVTGLLPAGHREGWPRWSRWPATGTRRCGRRRCGPWRSPRTTPPPCGAPWPPGWTAGNRTRSSSRRPRARLAARGDGRAVEVLEALLATADPDGPAYAVALAAVEDVRDAAARRRLESVPRRRG
ncbi:ankyrin repeat domain-containing protein [Streptomyces sudanensis]|uniref:ankyrin repeat domain-containing protein n=1 Tax=Streptomyces sudanensis TaxID=436397 RepID=UPI0023F67459|nr:ankyrin repeat domain-containing protein [Streptomyces sudanensis]